jgi:hypothetical protein
MSIVPSETIEIQVQEYERLKQTAQQAEHATQQAKYATQKAERLEHIAKEQQQEITSLRQERAWTYQLFANQHLSMSQKAALWAVLPELKTTPPDEQGYVHVPVWKVAKKIGMSAQRTGANLHQLAEAGGIARKEERISPNETRILFSPTPLTAHPMQIQPVAPRNHGGIRQRCKDCGSENLREQRIVTCLDCGSIQYTKTRMINSEPEEETPVRQVEGREIDTNVINGREHETYPVRQVDQRGNNAHLVNKENKAEKPTTPPGGAGDPPLVILTNYTSGSLVGNLTNDGQERTDQEQGDQMEQYEQNEGETPVSQVDQREETAFSPAAEGSERERAAKLLLDVAGTADEHIKMSRTGAKKYYSEPGALTLAQAVAHLDGRATYGARLDHADGTTRATVFDTDTAVGWQEFQDAAAQLAAAGYKPLLEPSPAGRGGHLILLYTAHVNARAAYQQVCTTAPALATCTEYWPRSGGAQRVRLPAGLYVQPGLAQWCCLLDAEGNVLARDGHAAARILLDYQTPADLVPPLPPESEPPTPQPRAPRSERPITSASRDELHRQKYGEQTRLWIAFTPQQLAAWFNERNRVEDVLPLERTGAGLAIWRGERTASVVFTKDGEGWVDFGSGATRSDGKRDGGDAFELATRMSGQEKAAFLREVGHILKDEASRALLAAARAGKPPANWLADLMTEEGWRVYNENRTRAGFAPLPVLVPYQLEPEQELAAPMPVGGVVGFLDGAQTEDGQGEREEAQDQETPYERLYPPPQRRTLCCGGGWTWSVRQQQYVCVKCGQE